jgi:hypothetical protein
MMNPFAKIRFFFLIPLVGVMFFSCDPNEKLPPETILDFASIQYFGNETQLDSLRLHVNFQDGDGNIGLAKHDTFPPFVGKYRDNLFVYVYDKVSDTIYELMRKQNDKDIEIWDSIIFSFKVPVLRESTGSVKGMLSFSVVKNNISLMQNLSKKGMVRFEIYMYDRDLVKSNTVVTPDIRIQ